MLQPGTRSRYATAQDGVSMSLRKECDVRNPLSSQSGIVETRCTLAMQCANPPCSKELLYLREGRIELLELESHADDQFRPDDSAFAMKSLPSKFFWLCGECAERYILKRWTTSGLVLLLRHRKTADSHSDPTAPPAIAGTTGPPPSSLTSNPGAGSTRWT
jgi:hypothetical protein